MEIRALDPLHVYLRVYWLYWPDELPPGRQPYHGKRELVPSNAMQIIDAMTVNGRLKVRHWDEELEERPAEDEYYWRQTFDSKHNKLSVSGRCGCFHKRCADDSITQNLKTHCIDSKPANPDTPLLPCPACHKAQHASCIANDALSRFTSRATPPPSTNGVNGHSAVKDTPNGSARKTPQSASAKKATPRRASKGRRKSAVEEEEEAGVAEAAIVDGQVQITDNRPGMDGAVSTMPMLCLFCREVIPIEVAETKTMPVRSKEEDEAIKDEVKVADTPKSEQNGTAVKKEDGEDVHDVEKENKNENENGLEKGFANTQPVAA
jgi:hypothetical protein